jgi:hypothetical protein
VGAQWRVGKLLICQKFSRFFSENFEIRGRPKLPARVLASRWLGFGGQLVHDATDDPPRCCTVTGDGSELLEDACVQLDLLWLTKVDLRRVRLELNKVVVIDPEAVPGIGDVLGLEVDDAELDGSCSALVT